MVLALQASAGNAAVTRLVGPPHADHHVRAPKPQQPRSTTVRNRSRTAATRPDGRTGRTADCRRLRAGGGRPDAPTGSPKPCRIWTMSQHPPWPNCSPQRSGAPAPATEVQALAALWLGQMTVGIAKDAMRWLADALPRRGDTPASIGWWTSCGARPFGSRSISRHCCCPGWPTSAVRWPTRCCLRWRPTKMPTPNCGAMRAVCGSGSPTPRSRRGGRHTWIHRGKGVGP